MSETIKHAIMKLLAFLQKIYRSNVWLIKIVIVMLFMYLVYKNMNFNQIKSMETPWLLLGLTLVSISNICGNIFWWLMLGYLGLKTSFKDTIKPYWIGLFFNNLMPTNVGGDVVKGLHFKFTKTKPSLVITSFVYDRLFGALILVSIGVIAFFGTFYEAKFVIMVFVVVCSSLLLLLIVSKRLIFSSIKKCISRFKFLIPNYKTLSIILMMLNHIQINFTKKKLPSLFAYSFFMLLSQLLKIGMSYCLALGLISTQLHRLPATYVFFIVPVLGILSVFTITPGGIGLREYICSFFFKSMPNVYHPDVIVDYTPEIIIISLLGHVLVIASSIPGLFIYLKKNESTIKSI